MLDIWRDICQLTIEGNCRDKTGRTDSLIQNLDNLNQVQLMEIWRDNLDQSFSRISGVSDKKSIAREIWLVGDRTMICPPMKDQKYSAWY